jgi:galactokinase
VTDVLDALARDFERQLGRRPTHAARAPGRVNLIGEHTDYCEGFVLPCAIDRDTWVVAAPRDDDRYRVVSREQERILEFTASEPARRGDWGDYPRGVVAALAEGGVVLRGADLAIASELPLGSGLSSSAALCVGLGLALGALAGSEPTPRRVAEFAHRAENGFAGVPCGIMDAFASALGRAEHALLIDCRTQQTRNVRLGPDAVLLVAHSGVTRRLSAGGYGDRRAECERALAKIREDPAWAGVRSLRDLEPDALPSLERRLEPRWLSRVRHVVSENARVHAFVRALEAGDAVAAGACLSAGMRSLQDDFEVSVPELDLLCALGDATPGVYGSRLTGAGFGGCSLHWVAPEAVSAATEAIATGFEARFGRRPPVHRMRPANGAARAPL